MSKMEWFSHLSSFPSSLSAVSATLVGNVGYQPNVDTVIIYYNNSIITAVLVKPKGLYYHTIPSLGWDPKKSAIKSKRRKKCISQR